MKSTVAFVAVVGTILAAGVAFARWERSHRLVFGDQSGGSKATWALARVEARELVRHPTWLVAAIAVTAITTLLIVGDGGSETDAHQLQSFGFVGLPIAGLGLVVSAHRMTTRSRREGTDELFASTPTSPRARTAAHLASCLAPLPLAVVLMFADLGIVYSLYEYAPRPGVATLLPMLAFLLPAVGGGVVGVLLGRWLPVALAPLVGIAALLWLNGGVDPRHPRYRMLRVGVETQFAAPFDIVPYGWHLVFVAALVALGAGLALLRHGRTPWVSGVTAAAAVALVVTGWILTRPPSADAVESVVDRLERPSEHLSCSVRNGVEYCVDGRVGHWVDAWAPAVDAVVAQLPPGHRPRDLRLVQRMVVQPGELLPEVRDALDPALAWPDDGDLHPNYFLLEEHTDLPVAWQAAAVAVGLPPATSWERPVGCMAGGQSRTVLAHLLAARATPSSRRSFDEHIEWAVEGAGPTTPVPIDIEWDYAVEYPDEEVRSGPNLGAGVIGADGETPRSYVPIAGASGWRSDMLMARSIADLDTEVVDGVIAAHWDELVDPQTPSVRFAELAGLDDVESFGPSTPTSLSDPTACP